MRNRHPRYSIAQFVQPSIHVSPMFFRDPGLGQSAGPDVYGPAYYGLEGLGQSRGPDTMGPEYFGLERMDEVDRFFGSLGQSSVDEEVYVDTEEAELYGLSQVTLEDDKVSAAMAANEEIGRARTMLREAGRADLAEAMNTVAINFQSRLAAAQSSAEITSIMQWLAGKITNLLGQARSGTAPSGGTTSKPPPGSGGGYQPSASNGGFTPAKYEGSMTWLVLGGVALAAVGVYLLMQEAQ